MAYEYKFLLTYSINNANNCTSLIAKYTHILSGLISFVGKSKKSAFRFIKNIIWRKIQFWSVCTKYRPLIVTKIIKSLKVRSHNWETHERIILWFWVKVWCLHHLCDCFYVVDPPDSSCDPLVISMTRFDKGFDQAPCIERFLDNISRPSVFGWKNFRLRGKHDELMEY